MSRRHIFLHIFTVFFLVCAGSVVSAADLQSSSFIIRDPLVSGGGGNGTSASYEMLYSTDLVLTGTSSSASYEGRYGFLNFPIVTSPTLSVVAGDTEASLSWTAASASLGFTVSGYEVGVANTSGGPYTFTNVGNILAYTKTGLTNGETYYFIIRVLDAHGDAIALSSEVSITLSGGVEPPGEGGGGSTSSSGTRSGGGAQATFNGYAHPGGMVYVLKDGVLVNSVSVNGAGEFMLRVNNLVSGSYLFTFYGVDTNGVRSGLLTLPISFNDSEQFSSTRVFIPPTLSFDPSSTPEALALSGMTVPGAKVAVALTNGATTVSIQTALSDSTGKYSVVFPQTSTLEGLALRSLASVGALQSPFGIALHVAKTQPAMYRGDFSGDTKVNLVDFSILAYWHGRDNVPARLDLNGDGLINLTDFSILTYYWTG